MSGDAEHRAMRAGVALAALLALACAKSPAAPPAPPSAAAPPPVAASEGPRVIFPDGEVVRVEIAADDETRAQGLMYRSELRPGTGMLFFFPQDGEYPFWMKNTRIPLDIVWIDSARRVVHVKHDVQPCRVENCPSYAPNAIARYVLEVPAGVAKQHGIEAGDQLRFEGTEHVVVR